MKVATVVNIPDGHHDSQRRSHIATADRDCWPLSRSRCLRCAAWLAIITSSRSRAAPVGCPSRSSSPISLHCLSMWALPSRTCRCVISSSVSSLIEGKLRRKSWVPRIGRRRSPARLAAHDPRDPKPNLHGVGVAHHKVSLPDVAARAEHAIEERLGALIQAERPRQVD
jgi:hypothetical protein